MNEKTVSVPLVAIIVILSLAAIGTLIWSSVKKESKNNKPYQISTEQRIESVKFVEDCYYEVFYRNKDNELIFIMFPTNGITVKVDLPEGKEKYLERHAHSMSNTFILHINESDMRKIVNREVE